MERTNERQPYGYGANATPLSAKFFEIRIFFRKVSLSEVRTLPIVMTSMMLYLKRMTDMDKEVAEYSQTQVQNIEMESFA